MKQIDYIKNIIQKATARYRHFSLDYKFASNYVVHDSEDMSVSIEYAYVTVHYNGDSTNRAITYRFEFFEHYDSFSNKLQRLQGKSHKKGKISMVKAIKGREIIYEKDDPFTSEEPWTIPVYEVMNKHFDIITTYDLYEPITRLQGKW